MRPTDENDVEKIDVKTESPTRPVPIVDAKKPRRASGSVESPNSGGTSASREAAPRFILGQSTSSEDSRHSDFPHSYEEDHKPCLADLRNHSFPFVNLLQSAYNPANGTKKNYSSTSLNTTPKAVPEEEENVEKPAVEKVAESFRAAKISEAVLEEDEEEEEHPVESMELSEDSFVHFNQLSETGSAPSIGNEIGDYLKQLKTAPDMFQFGEVDFSKIDMKAELEKMSSFTTNFNDFISHINSVADE
uniref:Uncharacterized protein n=1 Tax=Caenorhabditis japonica TaxID=281687 RepID=A0A8R1IC40_CAEJA